MKLCMEKIRHILGIKLVFSSDSLGHYPFIQLFLVESGLQNLLHEIVLLVVARSKLSNLYSLMYTKDK